MSGLVELVVRIAEQIEEERDACYGGHNTNRKLLPAQGDLGQHVCDGQEEAATEERSRNHISMADTDNGIAVIRTYDRAEQFSVVAHVYPLGEERLSSSTPGYENTASWNVRHHLVSFEARA